MIGAINNINAKSWNLASAVLLLNSFFIAISLSMIAFILDFQPKIHSLVIFFSLSIFLVFIGHIFMIWKFELTSNIIRTVSKFYFKNDLINKKNKNSLNNFNFDLISFIAWASFLIGFIFPSILAAIYNEYRTTLFQLSFIFNSIGTFLTIIVTDKKASLLSDRENPTQIEKKNIINFLSNVLLNRLLATSIILIIVLAMFLII